MNRRLRVLAALVVGILIAVTGLAYATLRPSQYSSTSRLVLVPQVKSLNDISNLTSSFTSSGTAGTFVELIASNDTLAAAGATGLSAAVRAIPDSRVVEVALQGDQARVQPALSRLLRVATTRQRGLNDDWTTEVLEGAQPPSKAGPSTKIVLLATVLLAIFGGVLVLVALQRFGTAVASLSPRLARLADDDRDDRDDDRQDSGRDDRDRDDEDDGRPRAFEDERLEAPAEP